MYIDTHTHLHHRRFDKDRKQVLEQMEAVGIQVFLEVAMDLESNAIMREKLREAPMQVRFTAGVHPEAVEKLPEKPDEVLQQIAAYLKAKAATVRSYFPAEASYAKSSEKTTCKKKYLSEKLILINFPLRSPLCTATTKA